MIPFNKAYIAGKELDYMAQVCANGYLSGDGPFTKLCHNWLQRQSGTHRALLTHSCTAALEMAIILLNIQPGDEIIMPSFTFVSTANALVLRGGVPVFIDIRADTLNLDESLIEDAITARTKAILVVHYAGIACEMQSILQIAKRHQLAVIEDAAHGIMAKYQGKSLGAIGTLGAYSFHQTKNIISGEGGCLLVNDPQLVSMAKIVREKGTDRSRFLRGEVDKYTWQTMGSSFLPGELMAAFLYAQLKHANEITQFRSSCWNYYHKQLVSLEEQKMIRRPVIPAGCQHNAHIYYLLLAEKIDREKIIEICKQQGISITAHYFPLHSSPGGKQYARIHGLLPVTQMASSRLIRLPLWVGLTNQEQDKIINLLKKLMK